MFELALLAEEPALAPALAASALAASCLQSLADRDWKP